MKHWGSALFPLTLLFVLSGLTFWLRLTTEMPEIRRDGKHRHDPDYIITEATLRKIDPTGSLKYTLTATDVRHYPDDDTTDLIKPNLRYLDEKKPSLTIISDNANLSQDGEQVDLYGNVVIHRAASGSDKELVATSEKLIVLTDEEKAFTKSPVLITQGNSWVKGVGMQIDNRKQTYILESAATALLESRHAKKPTP